MCQRPARDQAGRKVADNFKETMRIAFDKQMPKWNYRAIPAQSLNAQVI
jgi:hypothetical protein